MTGDGKAGANQHDGKGARQAANPKQRPVEVFDADGDADGHCDQQGENGEQGAGVAGICKYGVLFILAASFHVFSAHKDKGLRVAGKIPP